MKQYPKVPRYDHGVVKDKLEHIFDDEVVVLEKLDGCNFRFMLYENEFDEMYTDTVREMGDDNQIVYGSRRVVKGTENEKPITETGQVDPRFMRGFRAIQNVDKEKISEYHSEFGAPLVFYCECMTFHHKEDYSDDLNLLGFEVYKQDEPASGYSGNPYDEVFDNFLDVDTAFDILEDIGIQTTKIIERVDSIDVGRYELPETTSFGEGMPEGVVVRSDKHKRRVKKVHDKFSEINDLYYGPSSAESPEEKLLMRYCTQARMAKIMKKMYLEGYDIEMDIIPELSERVYNDIWEEEWYEFKDINMSFNPSKFENEVTSRCAGFTERILKFAEDVDEEPIELLERRAY